MPRYWWVNQNQTYRYEVRGGFLWSPKTAAAGRRNYFYETMTQVEPGDVVFSYYETLVQAVGIAQSRAITAPKPDGFVSSWDSIGWLVEVDFMPALSPFRPRDHIEELQGLLPTRYSPLRSTGDGLQGVYLTECSTELATALLHLAKMDRPGSLDSVLPIPSDELDLPEVTDAGLGPKSLAGELERVQVAQARRGQGVFKFNVRLIESSCRLTGVTSLRHLRASHIKPWRASDDTEKLDGANGLLLSPHVDHLFDGGLITFRGDGRILRSSTLERDVLERWSLSQVESAGAFTADQQRYLEYHRDVVFTS